MCFEFSFVVIPLTDAIFALLMLLEKNRESQKKLDCDRFIKKSVTGNREELWFV